MLSVVAVFVGAFSLWVSPFTASAASYDGQSPVRSGCDSSAFTAKSKSFNLHGVSGTVYLRFSSSCQTAWAKVVLSQPLPNYYTVEGRISQNDSPWHQYYCSSTNGNGKIRPGETSCYSPMVSDGISRTAYASAILRATGYGTVTIGGADTFSF